MGKFVVPMHVNPAKHAETEQSLDINIQHKEESDTAGEETGTWNVRRGVARLVPV